MCDYHTSFVPCVGLFLEPFDMDAESNTPPLDSYSLKVRVDEWLVIQWVEQQWSLILDNHGAYFKKSFSLTHADCYYTFLHDTTTTTNQQVADMKG